MCHRGARSRSPLAHVAQVRPRWSGRICTSVDSAEKFHVSRCPHGRTAPVHANNARGEPLRREVEHTGQVPCVRRDPRLEVSHDGRLAAAAGRQYRPGRQHYFRMEPRLARDPCLRQGRTRHAPGTRQVLLQQRIELPTDLIVRSRFKANSRTAALLANFASCGTTLRAWRGRNSAKGSIRTRSLSVRRALILPNTSYASYRPAPGSQSGKSSSIITNPAPWSRLRRPGSLSPAITRTLRIPRASAVRRATRPLP